MYSFCKILCRPAFVLGRIVLYFSVLIWPFPWLDALAPIILYPQGHWFRNQLKYYVAKYDEFPERDRVHERFTAIEPELRQARLWPASLEYLGLDERGAAKYWYVRPNGWRAPVGIAYAPGSCERGGDQEAAVDESVVLIVPRPWRILGRRGIPVFLILVALDIVVVFALWGALRCATLIAGREKGRYRPRRQRNFSDGRGIGTRAGFRPLPDGKKKGELP